MSCDDRFRMLSADREGKCQIFSEYPEVIRQISTILISGFVISWSSWSFVAQNPTILMTCTHVSFPQWASSAASSQWDEHYTFATLYRNLQHYIDVSLPQRPIMKITALNMRFASWRTCHWLEAALDAHRPQTGWDPRISSREYPLNIWRISTRQIFNFRAQDNQQIADIGRCWISGGHLSDGGYQADRQSVDIRQMSDILQVEDIQWMTYIPQMANIWQTFRNQIKPNTITIKSHLLF